MESYTSFATVYDTFMDNVPYDAWCEYLIQVLEKYGVSQGIVLDLGCGTGNVTERLATKGYEMIGVDNAPEMLDLAMQKPSRNQYDILYLLQDMREFELYGTVNAVVSICDSMNYITEEAELFTVFQLVNNYLDPGGVFIFDLNTLYKYEEILGEQTIAETRETCSFIWDNYYDKNEQINEYELTLFVQEEESKLFHKFQEYHYQKAYQLERVQALLEEAGLEFVACYDAMTWDRPHKESERVYFIAKEVQKVRNS